MKEIINKYSDTGNKDLKSKSLKWNQYLDPEPENIDAESVAVNFNTESRVTGYEEEKVETTFTPYIREAL